MTRAKSIFAICLFVSGCTSCPKPTAPETLTSTQIAADLRVAPTHTGGHADVFVRPPALEYVLYAEDRRSNLNLLDREGITYNALSPPLLNYATAVGVSAPNIAADGIGGIWLKLCKGLSPMSAGDWSIIAETSMPPGLAAQWNSRCAAPR